MAIPRVVAIHGWSIDSRIWGRVRSSLRGRVDVLAPDLPGHGGVPVDLRDSDVTGYHDAAVGALAAWCEERDAVEAPMAAWAWGTQLLVDAIDRGLVRPPSVALISLAAPFQTPATYGAVTRDWPRYARALVRMMAERPISRDTEDWLARLMGEAAIVAVAGVQAVRWAPPGDHFRLPSGSVAILGGADQLNPPEPARTLLDGWGADTTVLDGIGHLSFIEDPTRFDELFATWAERASAC